MKKKAKLFLFHLSKKEGARVLLGLRKVNENEEYWWLPGGSAENNEPLIKAAMRELKEELEVDENTLNTINSYIEQGIYIPNISYETEVSENIIFFLDIGPIQAEPLPQIKEEFSDVRWFSVKELPLNMSREFHNIDNFFSQKWLKSITQL